MSLELLQEAQQKSISQMGARGQMLADAGAPAGFGVKQLV